MRVFVYGSLLPGQYNHGIAEPYIRSIVPGSVPGRLVEVTGQQYPALVRDEASARRQAVVRGCWLEVGFEGLAAMDALEDYCGIEESNDYIRVWTNDAFQAGLSGWVYLWESDRDCPPVLTDYWPEHRNQNKRG
ncbi:gamma-glutamylcyclotransferase family protein [Paenibacillus beijingensis]|uniref:gamma-glutamylcyclotransferase family protein n=1 Tax=Paenibacillus beijingensis TaxID=1126833 RepID=UPI000A6E64D2|nr:gamma-glutamylcyclotransferase family protein [Paenibacillus beijingensis]